MPNRKRIKLSVYVDLDPLPGAQHTAEDAQAYIGQLLNTMIPHYNPKVNVVFDGDKFVPVKRDS